jgi:hypothetical protein
MSVALIGFVGAVYMVIAISELWDGNHGLALVFASYAMANVGLIMVR